MPTEIVVVTTVLLLYAAIVVSPGPNFALISRLAISGARQTAIGATLGLACAATLYAVLSMSGLVLLLTRVGWLAGAVQVAGGLFLVYLGVKGWLHRSAPNDVGGIPLAQDSFARGLRLGLLVNLSNPKGIAFLTVSMPQPFRWTRLQRQKSRYLVEALPWKSFGMGLWYGCCLQGRRRRLTVASVYGLSASWDRSWCCSAYASSSRGRHDQQV